MPRHPKRDPATRRSKCRNLLPKQVARRNTTGAPPAAIHFIEQLLNRLKKAFGIVGDIFDSDAELKRLGMGNQEKLVSYINSNRIQPNH